MLSQTATPSRFASRFAQLKAQGKGAFIPFTLLGWPTVAASKAILDCLIDAEPAALELGLPFSDPIADGPVIQQAVGETLSNGFSMEQGFELIAHARQRHATLPIGLLVYYNTLFSQGPQQFFKRLAAVGADALLIADLPPECAHEVAQAAKDSGIELIFIVSPLTKAERLHQLLPLAGAFHYVVSRLGITGVEARYDEDLKALLDTLAQHSTLPKCVGFGISTPTQAQAMLAMGADGVITGSRILQLVREEQEAGRAFEPALTTYLASMVAATATLPSHKG
jgi:tryptophan synthase alpha chain